MSKKKKTLDELLEEAIVPVDEQPYEIPENWVWTKLGELGDIGSSKRIMKSEWKEEGIPFYRAREIVKLNQKKSLVDPIFITNERYLEIKEKYGVPQINDILITGVGTIGQTLIVSDDKPFYFKDGNVIWFKNKFNINVDYLKHFMNSSFFKDHIKGMAAGTTVDTYTITNANESLIALPPIDEQKRIANKIEILFAKLDDAKKLIDEAKETFEFRRAAILEKAFSGELTLEYRNANQCIELIEPLASRKKFKTQIDQSINDTLYTLPENWKWITLNNLIESMTYGSSAKTDDDSSGKAVLRMGNIQDGSLLNDNLKYLPLNHLDVKKFVLKEKDILFNRTNSYELVGKSALVTQEFEGYSFASYLIRLSLIDKELLAPYVVTFINSKIGRKMLLSMVTQQVGQANINSQKLASLPIPLPSKNEIVEINKIIENLKAKERKAIESLNLDVDFANLKQSILSKAFKGEIGTYDLSDEPAIELLKSILQEKL